MPSENDKDYQPMSHAAAQEINTCPNCNALMPRELRFCRGCGHRLGEGIEEYTETVRFQSAPDTARNRKARTAWATPQRTSRTDAEEFKAEARRIHEKTVRSLSTGFGQWKVARACKRVPRWMVWVIVPIMIASMTGGFMSNSNMRRRSRTVAGATAANSFLGAHYKTVDGGALVQDILPPGSAADKAGLIGGDVITSFDGKAVRSESDM
ncbi:MAG TPA: PDZ domain-containing protein, partial [Pyrinomonadaceae bacterium]|nr:PDZ domain-containing protein [Pyrinomonadaceae bacterium]